MSHTDYLPSPQKGIYTLKVSSLVKDYPGTWATNSQLTNFVRGYMAHAIQYLSNHGYQARIKIVEGFDDEKIGHFDFNPNEQRSMRIKIMADYLSPAKKELNCYQKKSFIDYGH